jgi:hypothetical protein
LGFVRRLIFALAVAALNFASPAHSEGRETIGAGRLFNNDYLGDGSDRWPTGSYVYSHIMAREDYTGQEAFGDLIEYRLRAEIIAPRRGTAAPGDRPYVGAVSLGAHTHFDYSGTKLSLGADIMALGPQTGLSDFQLAIHDAFDISHPPHVALQLGNRVLLNGLAAATRTYPISDRATFRPFVEAQIGAEDMVRAGGDIIFGDVAQQDLLLRDVVTGQLYRGTETKGISGMSYVIGADIASVFESSYLPSDMGYAVSDTRARARAGVYWQMGDDVSFFYGATYLGEEFEGQSEGQVLGSLKVNFNF